MIRRYQRCTVKGWKQDSDNGKKTSWKETVIFTEGQDPLRIAMIQNPGLSGCSRFQVSTPEDAFSVQVRQEQNTMQIPEEEMKKYGYKDMRNKWSDPEYRW